MVQFEEFDPLLFRDLLKELPNQMCIHMESVNEKPKKLDQNVDKAAMLLIAQLESQE